MNNPSSSNLDDVDDELFISKKPQNYIFADSKVEDALERTNRMMLNTRSIVYETESIGQATLENLSSQREVLEKVDNDLDSIITTQRSTQKHLNNMKSWFGGFKSIFSRANSTTQPALAPSQMASAANKLPRSATLADVQSNSIPKTTTATTGPSKYSSVPASRPQTSRDVLDGRLSQSPAIIETPVNDFDANLSEIGFGLSRLKEMATKLGDEIGDQNDLLDRITDKSERAGDSIKHQNRQVQQLLKKG